jgi:chemotaxis protein CheX
MIDQLALSDVMVDAAKEVFETMIFMDIETTLESSPSPQGQSIFASITFIGSMEGRLTIHVSHEGAMLIAKNMLGMDPQATLSIEETCDAIGEVANMVLGSIKTRIQDQYPDIEVSVPSVILGRVINNTYGDQVQRPTVCVHLIGEQTAEFMLIFREGRKE